MRDDKPHGQWVVLQALMTLPPFGNVSNMIRDTTAPRISRSGTRTRLKELADMGLVSTENRAEHKHRFYHITPIGWRVAQSGIDGVMVLRIMRATHATLENRRAVELAPIKQRWQRIIENEMRRIVMGI